MTPAQAQNPTGTSTISVQPAAPIRAISEKQALSRKVQHSVTTRPQKLPRSHQGCHPIDIISNCAVQTTISTAPPKHPALVPSKACPSIEILSKHLAQAVGDVERFHSIATALCASLMSIERSLLGALPKEIAQNSDFELACSPVGFTVKQFAAAVRQYEDIKNSSSRRGEWMATVNDLCDVVNATLDHAFNVARRVSTSKKPLPPLPLRSSTLSSLEQIPEGGTPTTSVGFRTRRVTSSMITSNPFDNPKYIVHDPRSNGLRENRRVEASRQDHCQGSSHTEERMSRASLATLVANPAAAFSQTSLPMTDVTLGSRAAARMNHTGTDVTYIPRQSDIYFPPDPLRPDVDVQMPLPLDLLAVRKDVNGRTRAASVAALIRLLTSKEAVHDPDLFMTFFFCFRWFCTPVQFVQALMARYSEQPHPALDDPQQRVFKREAASSRIRVARTLITWLEQYWRPLHDNEALRTIQTFATTREANELPESLIHRMTTALIVIETCSKSLRSVRRIKCIERQLKPPPPPPPDPTCFTFDPFALRSSTLPLIFNTDTGREELARQLTMYAHELYLRIDPEDAVMEWRKPQQLPVVQYIQRLQALERGLTLWVIDTIVQHNEVSRRAKYLGFWASVASNCCAQRNYCVAFSIYCALSTTSIRRLRQTHTVLRKPIQELYLNLEETFSYRRNWTNYRGLLAQTKNLPTVPLLVCFKRDIVTSEETVPANVPALHQIHGNTELVNLRAYGLLVMTILTMEACLLPYRYAANQAIHAWIKKCLSFYDVSDERRILDEFLERSYQVEAKGVDLPEPGWMRKAKPQKKPSTADTGNVPKSFLAHVLNRAKTIKHGD